jgi:hypothetical protein
LLYKKKAKKKAKTKTKFVNYNKKIIKTSWNLNVKYLEVNRKMLPGRFSTYLYLKSWFVAILTQMSVEEFCRVVEIMYKRFEDTSYGGVLAAQTLVFCLVLYLRFFVILSFSFRPLYCLSSFNLWLLITTLVSSNLLYIISTTLQNSSTLICVNMATNQDLRYKYVKEGGELRCTRMVSSSYSTSTRQKTKDRAERTSL